MSTFFRWTPSMLQILTHTCRVGIFPTPKSQPVFFLQIFCWPGLSITLSNHIICRDQQLENNQIGRDNLWHRVSPTIDGFQTFPSRRFPAKGWGQHVVFRYFTTVSHTGVLTLQVDIIKKIKLEISTAVRF